jgi:carboxyl-terminal processing protease
MLESFRQYALKDSTVRATRITSQDEQEIARRLKALLARQIWNTEGYYQVSNSTDPMVEKAISVLDK